MPTTSELSSGSMLDDHQPTSAADGAESADRFAVPGFDSVARLAARSLNVPLVALVLHDGSAYWYTTDAGNPAHTFETPAPVYLQPNVSTVRESGRMSF